MSDDPNHLKGFVRDIADFPEDGITFRDITPLLGDPAAHAEAVDRIAGLFDGVQVVGSGSAFIMRRAMIAKPGAKKTRPASTDNMRVQ